MLVPVMLRGRCSCAISECPTPSPFASPSLSHPLTPLFPLDASHSPVTPLFPLHTQKQGGTPLRWYDQSFQSGILLLHVHYGVKCNCRRADIPALARDDGQTQERLASEGEPYTSKRNPGNRPSRRGTGTHTPRKVGHYMSDPKRATQTPQVRRNNKVAERSLDYATRRARLQRERENRVAPLGMTVRRPGQSRGDWW